MSGKQASKQALWPEIRIKSCPLFFQSGPKCNYSSFLKIFFFSSPKVAKYFDYSCTKIIVAKIFQKLPNLVTLQWRDWAIWAIFLGKVEFSFEYGEESTVLSALWNSFVLLPKHTFPFLSSVEDMWPDLANFCQSGEIYKVWQFKKTLSVFGNLEKHYLVFLNILNLFW